jgi:hypothetical protein
MVTGRSSSSAREREGRVLAEDRGLEFPERLTRLEAELVVQHHAHGLVGL